MTITIYTYDSNGSKIRLGAYTEVKDLQINRHGLGFTANGNWKSYPLEDSTWVEVGDSDGFHEDKDFFPEVLRDLFTRIKEERKKDENYKL